MKLLGKLINDFVPDPVKSLQKIASIYHSIRLCILLVLSNKVFSFNDFNESTQSSVKLSAHITLSYYSHITNVKINDGLNDGLNNGLNDGLNNGVNELRRVF